MRRVFVITAAFALAWAVPAGAQVSRGFIDGRLTLGGIVGAGADRQAGALAGATVGLRWTDRIDVIGEGLWSQDAVTRKRMDLARALAAHVQSTQGAPASGTVRAPAVYAGGGVRIFLLGVRAWRPYLSVTAGSARIALQPEITLAGGDITSRLPEFGISLGRDLTGVLSRPAYSAGLGLRTVRGRWHLDLGVRYLNVQTKGQPTTLVGATGSLSFAP